MPLFRYTCKECGKSFELLVKDAGTAVKCPDCQSDKVTKSLSRFSPRTAGSMVPCAHADSCPAADYSCGCGGCCGHHHS